MWKKRRIGQTNLEVTELGLGTATMGGSRIGVTQRRRRGDGARRLGRRGALCRYGAVLWCGRGRAPVSATRCATSRATNGCCRPRSAACCARANNRAGRPTGAWRRCPLKSSMLQLRRHHALGRGQLSALGLAKIDILFVHDIGVYQHGAETHAAHMKILKDSGYRALEELKRTGVVSAIGIGVNEKAVLIEALGSPIGTCFCLPDAIRCWSRRRWMICCRYAPRGGRRSWWAGR